MDKNCYQILGLEDDEIIYFLSQNGESEQSEDSIKMRDEIIRNAYEKRKREIEDEYHEKMEKAKSKHALEKQIIDYGKKMNTIEKIKTDGVEIGRERNQSEYEEKIQEIQEEFERKMKKLEFAYSQVKTEELRVSYNRNLSIGGKTKEYKEHIEGIVDEIEEKHRKEKMEQKYSKMDQYDPDLLETIQNGKLKGEKVVLRKQTKDPITIYLQDDRNIRIKQTATIHYRNATGTYNSYVNEYEITRIVDGEEKVDIVYTDVAFPKLNIDKKTNQPSNPNYHNCVANKLLSEEAIEGSKFNGGYIGLIERTADGQYDTTIDKKKKLSAEEQENLAAVMTLKEREERNNSDGQQPEGEDR